MAQAAGEPDQDKQVALYNQAQTILMDDAAFLPLRFAVSTFEVQPYVGGYQRDPVRLAAAGRPVLRDHVHQEALSPRLRRSSAGGPAAQAGPPDIPSRQTP